MANFNKNEDIVPLVFKLHLCNDYSYKLELFFKTDIDLNSFYFKYHGGRKEALKQFIIECYKIHQDIFVSLIKLDNSVYYATTKANQTIHLLMIKNYLEVYNDYLFSKTMLRFEPENYI